MTYEPTAFADQLIVIWLPWILAASITDYTIFQWRWKWVTIERALSVWALVILAFTLSKTGLILGVGLIILGFILNLFNPSKTEVQREEDHDASPVLSLIDRYRFIVILAVVGVFVFVFYLLGTRVPYISRIWDFFVFFDEVDVRKYLIFIGFGSRITYWETAWMMFREYPIFGVGLGNYGIYFSDFLPYQKLSFTPELFLRLVPAVNRSRVASAKHFLLRILAEMGIVGFSLFLVFLIILGVMGLYLWRSRKAEERFLGSAGLIGLAAFIGDTFSFDSFAIPNPWVLFGLITAAFSVITKTNNQVSHDE
jgi:O-antigen ligase